MAVIFSPCSSVCQTYYAMSVVMTAVMWLYCYC